METALSPSELKQQARSALVPVYGEAAAVIILRGCVAIPLIGGVAVLAFLGETDGGMAVLFVLCLLQMLALATLSGALSVGAARYFLNTASLRNPQVIQLFSSFKNYRNTVEMRLLKTGLTLLWSLLLVVPGVIAALRYAMTSYIMAVNPNTKATDALRLSEQMMRGYKRAYFRLQVSFLGWYLLCLLTAGVGFFFIAPYIETAKAAFFNVLSEEAGVAVEVIANN